MKPKLTPGLFDIIRHNRPVIVVEKEIDGKRMRTKRKRYDLI